MKSAEQTLLREGETDPSRAYQNLILQETLKEKEWREQCEARTDIDEERKQKELTKLEEKFYYRRVINAQYFKQVKALIESRDFL